MIAASMIDTGALQDYSDMQTLSRYRLHEDVEDIGGQSKCLET